RLLLADPSCCALDANDPGLARFLEDDDPRWTKHLVAFDRLGEGAKEYVDADAEGHVRRIHRHVDAVTWPFAVGVACSLVPVSSVRAEGGLSIDALRRLRHALVQGGAPTRDIPLEGAALDLSTERGLLFLNEAVLRDLRVGEEGGRGPCARPARGTGRPPAPGGDAPGPHRAAAGCGRGERRNHHRTGRDRTGRPGRGGCRGRPERGRLASDDRPGSDPAA